MFLTSIFNRGQLCNLTLLPLLPWRKRSVLSTKLHGFLNCYPSLLHIHGGKKKAASLVHSLKTQENTHFKGHCIHSTLPTCMKHMTWCPGTHHSNLYRVGGPLQRALGDTGHPHCNILLTQSACTSFPVLIPCQLPSVPPVAGGLTNEPTKEVLQSITQHCEHTHLGTNKKCA